MVFMPWIFHQCAQNSGGVMIVLFFLETGMVIVSRRNRNYSSIIELYIGAEIFCKCGFGKGVLHVFFVSPHRLRRLALAANLARLPYLPFKFLLRLHHIHID